ncbi:cupredoxin domain-containing protein [Leucothrix pacifica]|uniref:Copper-binding protein n=1 Tax=Leucothrix pacifica TaxID=1247513 RepID=A0A317C687_9GAMM|nr:cupredoxin family protein [Leucothrix pacifica]PWQ92913.1 copper-binding protein [Leucothrix pacifica]
MKKINTWLLASLLTVGFSGASFASAEGEAKDDGHGDGHGDGHVMEGHEGHKMSAVGMPAEKGAVANKTITVHMMDTMRFNFSTLNIEEGDIVKFVVMNKGKIPHEFGIGSIEEQVAHRDMMKKMPGMKHEDGSTVSVEPGKSKELVWQFIGDATAQFACNVPGHFEAGMKAEVELH